MKESTKRAIAKVKCPITEAVAKYKGKPVSIKEAVRAVHEMRRERRLATNKSGH